MGIFVKLHQGLVAWVIRCLGFSMFPQFSFGSIQETACIFINFSCMIHKTYMMLIYVFVDYCLIDNWKKVTVDYYLFDTLFFTFRNFCSFVDYLTESCLECADTRFSLICLINFVLDFLIFFWLTGIILDKCLTSIEITW